MSLLVQKVKLISVTILISAMGVIAATWVLGSKLVAPVQNEIGAAPTELSAEGVTFASASGAEISGWFVPASAPRAAVVLMHPLRSDRRSMLGRARFLSAAGYSVLLFDFQAHGRSNGSTITFGHLESDDASAAVKYLRERVPVVPIVALGWSLGGAAALLADPPVDLDGVILEAVYPTVDKAIANRLRMRLGSLGDALTPVFVAQIEPRLGLSPEALRPIEGAKQLQIPTLVMSGAEDRRTTVSDTRNLFDAIQSEKRLWIVEGAKHEDLHRYSADEYERRVLDFLAYVTRNAD